MFKNQFQVEAAAQRCGLAFWRFAVPCLLMALTIAYAPAQTSKYKKMSTVEKGSKNSSLNKLTVAERAAGWKLLFDGKTTNEWRGVYSSTFPTEGWVIADDSLTHLASPKGSHEEGFGGDIVTKDEYANFELQLEWRISPGGNSGVKYFVTEQEGQHSGKSAIGLEMQILDDDKHPDAKLGRNGDRTAGSLYDLIPATNKMLRPVGEFNQARLIVRGNHVEHWLNGRKVVEYERHSPELRKLIAESKYKSIPGFGEAPKGHILLQDHGDAVSFRNIKIRVLPAS